MRFFDLFAGIGGFRLALERNNHICIGSCEWDKYARETYKKNFGEYPIYSDAKNIIPKRITDFDILCAGFPCQAFSFAGKRHGFEDIRGTLFNEIARIAKAKQPKLLFLENVKGLLNHDNGRTFSTILSTFDELGYDTEWQVINSKYFVPQNRERIFIIGHLRGESRRKVFPLGDCNRSNDETRRETQSKGSRIRSPLSRTIDANYLKGGGSRTMISEPKVHVISSTQYDRIRKLTPKECERLQGFPDDWTSGVSDSQRYKQCGNAVTVTVVEYIVKHLDNN